MWWQDKKRYPYERFVLRMIDISILGIMYFVGGLTIAMVMETIFPEYEKKKYDRMDLHWYILELFGTVSFVMIFAYILRHTIYAIPCAFDGVYGYEHSNVSEAKGGVIVAFSIFLLSTNFKEKIKSLVERIQHII